MNSRLIDGGLSSGRPESSQVSNRWGFESYRTEEAVRAHVSRHTVGWRGKGLWRIWLLPDGTFDYTSTDNPRAVKGLTAELVGYEPGATRA